MYLIKNINYIIINKQFFGFSITYMIIIMDPMSEIDSIRDQYQIAESNASTHVFVRKYESING